MQARSIATADSDVISVATNLAGAVHARMRLRHRHQVLDRKVGVGGCDGGTDLGDQLRSRGIAGDVERELPPRLGLERHVRHGLHAIHGERAPPAVGDDTDNGEPGRSGRCISESNPLPERAAIGPGASGECGVDHHDISLASRKQTPGLNALIDNPEVLAGDSEIEGR